MDLIDYPVVADPNPPEIVAPLELLRSLRTGVVHEAVDRRADPPSDRGIQLLELLRRGGRELDGVRHGLEAELLFQGLPGNELLALRFRERLPGRGQVRLVLEQF